MVATKTRSPFRGPSLACRKKIIFVNRGVHLQQHTVTLENQADQSPWLRIFPWNYNGNISGWGSYTAPAVTPFLRYAAPAEVTPFLRHATPVEVTPFSRYTAPAEVTPFSRCGIKILIWSWVSCVTVRERFKDGDGVPRHVLTLPLLMSPGSTQSSSVATLDIGESRQAVTIAGWALSNSRILSGSGLWSGSFLQHSVSRVFLKFRRSCSILEVDSRVWKSDETCVFDVLPENKLLVTCDLDS